MKKLVLALCLATPLLRSDFAVENRYNQDITILQFFEPMLTRRNLQQPVARPSNAWTILAGARATISLVVTTPMRLLILAPHRNPVKVNLANDDTIQITRQGTVITMEVLHAIEE